MSGARCVRLAALVMLVASTGTTAIEARQGELDAARQSIVLVLMSDASPLPALRQVLAGIQTTLPSPSIQLEVQYLDLRRADASDAAQQTALADWLSARYRPASLAALVAVDAPAATFLARMAAATWPGVPTVFTAVSTGWQRQHPALPERSIVVGANLRYADTVEAALGMFPDTREIVLMAGASAADREWLRGVRTALAEFESRVAIMELSGVPLAELESRARRFPAQCIALPVVFLADEKKQPVVNADQVRRMARASRCPTFTFFETAIGDAVVGGVTLDFEALGRETGNRVRRLIAGEEPADLSIADISESTLVLDWRQIVRWGVQERVPPNARVLFREQSLWARYWWIIEAVIAVVLIQGGVIGWLLLERRARRRAQQSLDDALGFERALGQIAGLLTSADPGSDRALREAARRVATHFGVDHAGVYEPVAGDGRLRAVAEHVAHGATAPPLRAAQASTPAVAAVLARGGVWPPAPVAEGEHTPEISGLTALMASPLRAAGHSGGALVVAATGPRPEWTPEHQHRLDAFAEIFANVLAHRRARVILHEHEALNRAVLGAHGGEVAVLDAAGVIVAVNEAWLRAADRTDGLLADARPGFDLLSAFADPTARSSAPGLLQVLEGVLNGGPSQAAADVEWDGPQGHMWSEVRVHRLDRADGGAVLSHMDITTRKRAELQVQQHLHEMAHLNMVAAVGELAASVAHELNQPLTAVLSNAQALRRLMNSPAADPQLMREILEDIIAQDQRAGDVIQRMRRLLKKEKIDWEGIDLNELVRDVARMFQGEASLGGVPVTIDLAPTLPRVQGDRVQLQQVVLNLLQNATHAVRGDTPRQAGRVLVSTLVSAEGVSVCVRDAGPGIAADLIDRVFDPFFTTKRQGLGLGLSISRSIVELHGGRILARNMPTGGAEFSFTIPVEAVGV